MKGAITALIIALIIVFSAIFLIKKQPAKQRLYPGEDKIYAKPPIERTEPVKLAIVEELPVETNAMAFAPSMGELITTFNIKGDSLLGFKLPDSYADFCDEIGINLLNLEELQNFGVDTKREIGFFSTGIGYNKEKDKPTFSLTFCLPVTENPALLDSLDAAITKDSASKIEKDDYTLYTDDEEEFALAVIKKNGYAYITLGSDQEKAEKEVKSLLRGKEKLSGSRRFNKAIRGLGNSGSLFCFIDISQMLSEASVMDFLNSLDATGSEEELEYFKELITFYRGAAFWLDISSKDFVIRSIVEIDPDNKMASMYSDNVVQNPVFNVQKNPIGILAQSFNLSSMYKDVKKYLDTEELDAINEVLDSINRELGIPADINLIELIGGNYGIGVYDGKSIGIGTYNALITLAVTNEKHANTIRKTLHKRLEEELNNMDGLMNSAYIEETTIEGVETSKLFIPMGGKFYLGVHDKQLILSSEKDIYVDAIKGSYKKGFSKNISDKNLKYAFDKRSMSMSYLDMHEALDIVDNFAGTLSALSSLGSLLSPSDTTGSSNKLESYEASIRKITKELRSIRYMLAYSQMDKEILTSELRIATDFKSSFPEGVAELARNCIAIIKELE